MTGERGRIVVGVDGSPCATAALRWALAEARLRGIDIELVTSWHAPYMAEASGYGLIYLSPEELMAEAGMNQSATLDQLAAEVEATRAAGGHVDARLLEGPPGPVLVTESKGADMLVVGRRGHSALTRLFLGSVSRHVTTHASCPVVVIAPAV